mgnify:CR=1 FL=1
MPPKNLNNACVTIEQIFCVFSAWQKLYSEDTNALCGGRCPPECHKHVLSVTQSARSYPTPVYYESLKNEPLVLKHFGNDSSAITYEALQANMLAVEVFYGDLSYRRITENPQMQLQDLISNFGGTLGLFLGVSFLSFAELLDLLVNSLYIVFYSKKKKTGSSCGRKSAKVGDACAAEEIVHDL